MYLCICVFYLLICIWAICAFRLQSSCTTEFDGLVTSCRRQQGSCVQFKPLLNFKQLNSSLREGQQILAISKHSGAAILAWGGSKLYCTDINITLCIHYVRMGFLLDVGQRLIGAWRRLTKSWKFNQAPRMRRTPMEIAASEGMTIVKRDIVNTHVQSTGDLHIAKITVRPTTA